MVLDAARGVAFVATWTSPTTILTVRASDQAALHTLTLPEGDEHVRVLLLDAVRNRLYAATFASPSRLIELSIDGEGAQRGGAEGTRGLGVEEEGEKRTIFLREREIAHGIGGAAGEDRIGEAEGADEGPVHP